MIDFFFNVTGAEPIPYAATPTIGFRVEVSANQPNPVHSIVLRCQIMLEVTRRHYTEQEKQNLKDLFGDPERWSQTLRTMLWTHSTVVVPPFTERTVVDMAVPCSFDFNVAATKYFAGLNDDEVPLSFLFSGTVFYQTEEANFQVSQISWEKEAKFRLPVKVWKAMMELYYPNTNWLVLRRDVFEKLYEFKVKNGIPTWEQTLEGIIPV